MEMAISPDGAHFNQYANENATWSCATSSTWHKRRSNSHDRDTTTDVPDFDRFASMPVTTSHYRRDLEDLLWERTQANAASDIDFSSLANVSLDQWEARGSSRYNQEGFHTYLRRLDTPNIPVVTEVLVTGELECSLAEAAVLLRCPREAEYNHVMSNMHERSFQRGSVVHSFTSAKIGTPDASSGYEFLTRYRSVKTACFARPRLALFDGDEQWCFLEEFSPLTRSSASGFTLSQRSLQPGTLPRAVRPPIELVRRRRGMGFKWSNKRTQQLLGLSLGLLVEAIAGRYPPAVRTIFYGCCSDERSGDFNIAQRRMKLLARGVLKLPAMVRRRRMSAQVPADTWTITRLASKHPSAPTSSRCVGCSRTLHRLLMVKKTHCYLCAHFVCPRCWIRQPLEAPNGRSVSVLVCSHCMLSVQHCNYTNLAASSLSDRGSGSSVGTSSRISMFAGGVGGEVAFHTAEVLPDAEDAPEPGHAVIAHLQDIFSGRAGNSFELLDSGSTTDLSSKTQTAVNVLQQLVDEGGNCVLAQDGASTGENTQSPGFEISLALERLHIQFAREVLPLEACVLSSAITRTYPITHQAEVLA